MRIERSTTELHPHRLAVVVCSMKDTSMRARLAEWSKAWDLSSHNRKIAWVRTPHLAWVPFANRLQWRNRLAHGTYRQYKELCRGCEFEPHLEQQSFLLIENEREKLFVEKENISPRPGIEPGPSTWQAEILTTRLSRNCYQCQVACLSITALEPKISTKTPSSRIWTSDLWISDIEQLQSTALPTELSKAWRSYSTHATAKWREFDSWPVSWYTQKLWHNNSQQGT